jgi:hypothetical protein
MTTCYVIASGPSLKGFDFDRLPDGYRIGANKSAWIADCNALVTIDKRFWRGFQDEIKAFNGGKYVTELVVDDQPRHGAHVSKRGRFKGMSESLDELTGTNSGFAALNIAYLLGYKEIALLGFDFKWDGDKSHFHDGYRWQARNTSNMLPRWAREFDHTVEQFAAKGVNVINFVGPNGSNVTAFPMRPLEDLI